MHNNKILLSILFVNSILQYFISYWWLGALVAFAFSWFFSLQQKRIFIQGFLGLGLSWLAMALILDYKSGFVLSEKLSKIFNLHSGSYLIYLITCLPIAFIGGLSALSAYFGKKWISNSNSV